MLKVLDEFRNKLDSVMIKAIGKRVVLYGYGRTGQFLEWYADYYHSIKVDYIITLDWNPGVPRNFELYSDTLFEYDYKDVKNAVVWLAIPENEDCLLKLENGGYRKNETWFSFYEIVYGENYVINEEVAEDVFKKKKTGIRDIQFMDWLEYCYNCNFLENISFANFEDYKEGMRSYVITAQKEIFYMLDKCHCKPKENDGIFDFGCGKGGAMVSFLDYGFNKVGGVEYQRKIYEILVSNFEKLGVLTEKTKVSCIHGDAGLIKEELDEYNWFYYFEPFDRETFSETVRNIVESLKRKPRKIHIINLNPLFYDEVLNSGCFELTNQFWVATRKKVVDVFVTKKEYEEL